MENRQKTQIADELVYTAKWFSYGLIFAFVCCFLFTKIEYFLEDFDEVLLCGLVFIGIGYGCRLVKWVIKWKS